MKSALDHRFVNDHCERSGSQEAVLNPPARKKKKKNCIKLNEFTLLYTRLDVSHSVKSYAFSFN